MNRYPLWKYLLLLVVLGLGALYALPNIFPEQPAIQVSRDDGSSVASGLTERVRSELSAAGIESGDASINEGKLLIRVGSSEAQLRAADALKQALGNDYIVALNLAPTTPDWLRSLGAKPMNLGLDLRGGVHFLLEVDMATVIEETYDRYARDLPRYLRDNDIRYSRAFRDDQQVKIRFPTQSAFDAGQDALNSEFSELDVRVSEDESTTLVVTLSEEESERIRDFALEQNLTTLRNRVNEIGVAEPLVQRQGQDRIVVELPGVQDTAQAKRLLGKTATLEYRLVARGEDPRAAEQSGVAPPGTELHQRRSGEPILLDEDVIASGDQLVDASSGFDQQSNQPAVFVTLNGAAAERMFNTTQEHVGDPMAVLFIENKIETRYVDGEPVYERKKIEEVISVATIRGVFGKRFQTTGLSSNEAHDLALLLRAGALAAPVQIVEERTVGPSLGKDNIAQGRNAVIIGFLLVVVFMLVYYRAFGVFANAALFTNVLLIVALLSLLQATLTLPGIAGIVLTVGMAVDANVLIFERIREELDSGSAPQSAIASGYDKALSSIADANVTTLIAAVVLFGFGTGPIKGFAVTLSLGILTSMFTAIIGTRALANLVYGRRQRLQSVSV
ncbi:protein translocase subunit SecD [Salinisphaera sp. P385]|uniref:Protein translocase subunit SecD n=1 Tax=Spectribacter acetivorans TaxID=3075603 RepID=A0ABU3B9L2_9GAMM|nr:protein translocase subunit SecD [Salinisphaera sp. P385]MDT0619161.1 protein translocase subunit SecD [Salinisphaera sp. P385]